MKHSLMKLAPVLMSLATLAACGGDSTTSPSALAGTYNAVIFTTAGSSGQTDQIIAGSTLTINLASNGLTTGHLHVVASGSTPALDADMAGTWTQNGNSVTFSQAADTFVRNTTFAMVAAGSTAWDLEGVGTFSGTEVRLTLRRVGP